MKHLLFVSLILTFLVKDLYGAQPDMVPESTYIAMPKSEVVARNMSISATVIPCVLSLIVSSDDDARFWLSLSGLVIGPSVGHFYAEQWSRGFTTAGIRLGLGVVTVYTVATALGPGEDMWDAFGNIVLATGAAGIAIISHAMWDIAQTEKSVRKYNERIKFEVQPEIDLQEGKYGIGVVYRF